MLFLFAFALDDGTFTGNLRSGGTKNPSFQPHCFQGYPGRRRLQQRGSYPMQDVRIGSWLKIEKLETWWEEQQL